MLCEICNKKLNVKASLEKFNLLDCINCSHTVSNLIVNKNITLKPIQTNMLKKNIKTG